MQAEVVSTPISPAALAPEYLAMSKYLHTLLLGLLREEPLEVALSQQDMNGFEVLRRVAVEAGRLVS
jgi:hypothetical protein